MKSFEKHRNFSGQSQKKMSARFITILVVTILLIIFVIQNKAPFQVKFLFWSWIMSRSVLILLVFAFGVIFGWISLAWSERKKRKRVAE